MASQRIWNKIRQIVRLRVGGIKDIQIANMMSMTNSGLQRILRLQEYKDEEEAYLNGVLTKQDEALAGQRVVQQQIARTAVPAAYQTMIDLVMQKRDPKVRFAAAKEILDRDPDGIHLTAKDKKEDSTGDGSRKLPPSIFQNLRKESDQIIQDVGVPLQAAPPLDKSQVN